MTRDELIEKMAREVFCHFFRGEWPPDDAPDLGMDADEWRAAMRKTLAAIESAGFAIAPKVATSRGVRKGRFAFGNPDDCRACRERPDDDFAAVYRVMVEDGMVK